MQIYVTVETFTLLAVWIPLPFSVSVVKKDLGIGHIHISALLIKMNRGISRYTVFEFPNLYPQIS